MSAIVFKSIPDQNGKTMKLSTIVKFIGITLFSYLSLLAISYSNPYQPVITVAIGVIIFTGIKFIIKLYDKHGNLPVFLGMLIIGGLLRFLWAALVPTEPISDFLHYHNGAMQLSNGIEVSHKNIGYTLLLSIGYRIFPNVLTGKIINAFASTASLIVVYFIGEKLVNQRTALIAMFILAILPNEIIMGSVLGTEVAITALGVTVLLLLIQSRNDVKQKLYVKTILSAGVFYGLAVTVRSSYVFYFPAIFLWLILINLRDRRNMSKNIFLFGTGTLVGILLITIIYTLSTGVFSLKPLHAQDSFPFLSGTNIEYSGRYNSQDINLYDSWPAEERDQLARLEAINRIKSSPLGFLFLLPRKMYVLIGPNDYWNICSLHDINWGKIEELLVLISQAIYITILLSSIFAYKNSDNHQLLNIILILTLSSLLPHLILEVQARYHHYILPFWILLAATGLQEIIRTNKQRELPQSKT